MKRADSGVFSAASFNRTRRGRLPVSAIELQTNRARHRVIEFIDAAGKSLITTRAELAVMQHPLGDFVVARNPNFGKAFHIAQ
jgi:hypothetical protein